jgi:hypothetical protein
MGEQVIAICDYSRIQPDELSLKTGDIITVLEKFGDGWWKGKVNGNVGVFPSTFSKPYSEVEAADTAEVIVDMEDEIESEDTEEIEDEVEEVNEQFEVTEEDIVEENEVSTQPEESMSQLMSPPIPNSQNDLSPPEYPVTDQYENDFELSEDTYPEEIPIPVSKTKPTLIPKPATAPTPFTFTPQSINSYSSLPLKNTKGDKKPPPPSKILPPTKFIIPKPVKPVSRSKVSIPPKKEAHKPSSAPVSQKQGARIKKGRSVTPVIDPEELRRYKDEMKLKQKEMDGLREEIRTLKYLQRKQAKALEEADKEKGTLPHDVNNLSLELKRARDKLKELQAKRGIDEKSLQEQHHELVELRQRVKFLGDQLRQKQGSASSAPHSRNGDLGANPNIQKVKNEVERKNKMILELEKRSKSLAKEKETEIKKHIHKEDQYKHLIESLKSQINQLKDVLKISGLDRTVSLVPRNPETIHHMESPSSRKHAHHHSPLSPSQSPSPSSGGKSPQKKRSVHEVVHHVTTKSGHPWNQQSQTTLPVHQVLRQDTFNNEMLAEYLSQIDSLHKKAQLEINHKGPASPHTVQQLSNSIRYDKSGEISNPFQRLATPGPKIETPHELPVIKTELVRPEAQDSFHSIQSEKSGEISNPFQRLSTPVSKIETPHELPVVGSELLRPEAQDSYRSISSPGVIDPYKFSFQFVNNKSK